MTAAEQLAAGAEALGIGLGADRQAALLTYLQLIEKWNQVHNLTAIRDPAQMVTLHLLDSLAVLPHLGAPGRVVDVGSGAGLPGVAIALACPGLAVTVVDASHKKAAFLEQARTELGLSTLSVVCDRVERWQPAEPFDVVISRAFADLADFVSLAGHLVAPGGAMLAMKGLYPYEEIARLPATHRVDRVEPVRVPGLNAERHVVFVRPR